MRTTLALVLGLGFLSQLAITGPPATENPKQSVACATLLGADLADCDLKNCSPQCRPDDCQVPCNPADCELPCKIVDCKKALAKVDSEKENRRAMGTATAVTKTSSQNRGAKKIANENTQSLCPSELTEIGSADHSKSSCAKKEKL